MKRMLTSKLIAKIKALFTSLWTDDNGNVEIGKNLTVDGVLKQNTYEIDKDIPISFSSGYTSAGFSKAYAHARVSNKKLNIVLCIKCAHPVSAVYGIMTSGSNSLTLPSEILSKLYPIIGNSLSTTAQSCGIVFKDDGSISTTTQQSIVANIEKTPTGITWSFINNQSIPDSATANYFWRFEFNFVLS